MINARNSLSESLIITSVGSGKTVLILILMSREGRSQNSGVRSPSEPGAQEPGVQAIELQLARKLQRSKRLAPTSDLLTPGSDFLDAWNLT